MKILYKFKKIIKGNEAQAVVEIVLVSVIIIPIMLWAAHFWELFELKFRIRQAVRYGAFERTAYTAGFIGDQLEDLSKQVRHTIPDVVDPLNTLAINDDLGYSRPEKSMEKLNKEIMNPDDYRFFPGNTGQTTAYETAWEIQGKSAKEIIKTLAKNYDFENNFRVSSVTTDLPFHIPFKEMQDLFSSGRYTSEILNRVDKKLATFLQKADHQGELKLKLLIAWMRIYPGGMVSSASVAIKAPAQRVIPQVLLKYYPELRYYINAQESYDLVTETWMANSTARAEESSRNLFYAGIMNRAFEMLKGVDIDSAAENNKYTKYPKDIIGIDYFDVPPNGLKTYVQKHPTEINTKKRALNSLIQSIFDVINEVEEMITQLQQTTNIIITDAKERKSELEKKVQWILDHTPDGVPVQLPDLLPRDNQCIGWDTGNGIEITCKPIRDRIE